MVPKYRKGQVVYFLQDATSAGFLEPMKGEVIDVEPYATNGYWYKVKGCKSYRFAIELFETRKALIESLEATYNTNLKESQFNASLLG